MALKAICKLTDWEDQARMLYGPKRSWYRVVCPWS